MPHSIYMQRCFDLARLGSGYTSPNPMVGAVLVVNGRIIGEGYHAKYGGAHAEVMAVASVAPADKHLIAAATLYVSLEPCNIHGNTPPCTDLILRERIPHVVVAASDFTPGVAGSGLERLRQAGVLVETGVLQAEGETLARVRNTFVTLRRPYVLLKYAQSADGFLAPMPARPYWISHSYTNRLVHKWRTETDAILVGAQTARTDNPALTVRHRKGKQPLRLLIDRHGTLPLDSNLLDGQFPTRVFTANPGEERSNVQFQYIDFERNDWLKSILSHLHELKIAHLTVEGGAWLLQQFMDNWLWDEARVITGAAVFGQGLSAPDMGVAPTCEATLERDTIRQYFRE